MRFNVITLACAVLLAVGLSLGVGAGPIVDSDGDGVIDELDSCKNQANADQCDRDLDGYGNGCDGDFDNNFTIGIPDFSYFGKVYGSTDQLADLDCNNTVGIPDFSTFGKLYGSAPGPSGLICAGVVACSGI
jgi:hypothetical protein